MVQLTVTASVRVAGGPTLPVSTTLEPQSYTYATVILDATGAGASRTIDLLPDGGTVVVLALSAKSGDGNGADVKITPANGAETGDEFVVDGTLVVANPGVLAALVAGGPRTVVVKNEGPTAVTVEILTGLKAA